MIETKEKLKDDLIAAREYIAFLKRLLHDPYSPGYIGDKK